MQSTNKPANVYKSLYERIGTPTDIAAVAKIMSSIPYNTVDTDGGDCFQTSVPSSRRNLVRTRTPFGTPCLTLILAGWKSNASPDGDDDEPAAAAAGVEEGSEGSGEDTGSKKADGDAHKVALSAVASDTEMVSFLLTASLNSLVTPRKLFGTTRCSPEFVAPKGSRTIQHSAHTASRPPKQARKEFPTYS